MPDVIPVSVFLAASNAADTLGDTLESVQRQDYDGAIEVVVAAADRATAETARRWGARVVDNPIGTTPRGLNLAIGASSHDILVRVDAHSVIPTDYITSVVEALRSTGASNVGGRQVPSGEGPIQKGIAAAMRSKFGAGDARYRVGGPAGPTDTVYLGTFHRSTMAELGGYDERFLRHQDYELNHRILISGGIVWLEPDIEVVYRPRSSIGALARQYFQYGQFKRFFAATHPGSLRWRHLAPPWLVLVLIVAIGVAPWWPWSLTVPIAYGGALLAASLKEVPRIGAGAIFFPIALATMHLSWGVGFLLGHTSDS